VVCTFLALLELIRLRQLVCSQPEAFGEIEIRRATVTGAPVAVPAAPASEPLPAAAETSPQSPITNPQSS
jgi:segregation and condensation protein A